MVSWKYELLLEKIMQVAMWQSTIKGYKIWKSHKSMIIIN